ncbi:MAG: asparagine synthetase B [Bacteroidetes bacterium]|nr:asparagine synthetase B [Bacteroidota bacterium]MBU1371900.1 asparagine synthetase B [Bacteroidota bacterium]MBU1483502.1 asparagine synthetase B [Bacteroidota bacterium]MBU1761030.1 asparagine synthetase B [Bacteroidota bacterium]MBU2267832.1 asparagine synthetase B [Bacteroidota bacterium]
MDEQQRNHLKAYGVAFWVLKKGLEVDWLLNYKGGSFLIAYNSTLENELKIRGVSYDVLADAKVNAILTEINNPEVNMDLVKLEKAPKIAVYSPKSKLPWDDAVTMVLTYAEIPYDVIYDEEVVGGKLPEYDWLHLHHEDFTGQYGRFWANYRNAAWYQDDVKYQEFTAKKLGFKKVSQMKLAVAEKIRDFCGGGGFLFAMCSGTDSYDIALAAAGIDICENMFDGDGVTPNAQSKLDFTQTFAFQNFKLDLNPMNYEFSDIDVTNSRRVDQAHDYFTLFDFSAKWDVVPTMLTQNHEKVVKGFMGQTTAFKESLLKPNVLVMGELKSAGEARYIHGEFGKGQWTFYGGHDPEDYQHLVGDPPTDLNLYPNSPGYRLILNNILFPAAKKKKQKT